MRYTYLILAAMFLLCLAPMPIGYFSLVRLVAVISFGVMAYKSYVAKKEIFAWTFGILALLFQPFFKITLGRTVWNIIDVVVAIGFILLFLYENNMLKKIPNNPPKNPIDDSPKLDKLDKNEFAFKLSGKLAPKELIYVASEEDPVLSDLFEKNPEVIEGWGKMIGFHVIYLPLLMKRLADEKVLKYRAPYLSDAEVATASIGNDFILKHLENPDDRKLISQGFMRTEDIHRSGGKDQAINRFYPISSASSEPIADQLHRIGKQIALEGHKGHGSRFQIDEKRLDDYQKASLPPSKSKSSKPNVYYDEWDACEDMGASVTPSFDADQHFNSQQMGENTDDLIEEIKERIAKLRQRGIAEYILEQLIHPDDRLSRLVITKDYRIVLPDYNNMEIKMEPLVKAVYLLFLKHPEGLLFKHLPDYRKELTAIYNKLKPYGLTDRALQSIEDVTNPLLNSINEKCARIRGAFVGQFDNYMAKNYYIDGVRGEAKKISLPRNLVIWE